MGTCMYTWVDNWQVSVIYFKRRPTRIKTFYSTPSGPRPAVWVALYRRLLTNWLLYISLSPGNCSLWAGVNQQPPAQQFRMRPFKLFWGWTKNTSSPAWSFGFFQSLLCPKAFPSYLPPPSYLPTSPHFALTPSSKLGRAWSGRAKLRARSERAEVATNTKHFKQKGRSESQKWEGRAGVWRSTLFLLFVFFLVVFLHVLSSMCSRRRRWWRIVTVFFYGGVTAKKVTAVTTICRHLLLCVRKEEDEGNVSSSSFVVML